MTEQVQDSCSIDGRVWAIEEWHGDTGCIPTNEQIGIQTISPSTANYRGRIDHFLVHKGLLRLFKMEVSLALKDAPKLPKGARREVHHRHVPISWTTDAGTSEEVRIERSDFFLFDNLIIPFTGKIDLSFPYFDGWNLPWPLEEQDEQLISALTLVFEEGVLVTSLPKSTKRETPSSPRRRGG
jgi:hypothetical protein